MPELFIDANEFGKPEGMEEPNGNQNNNPDGSNPNENNSDGNNSEGNKPDGNNPDKNNLEGNKLDGNNLDGNNSDGNKPDGNNPDGNKKDGELLLQSIWDDIANNDENFDLETVNRENEVESLENYYKEKYNVPDHPAIQEVVELAKKDPEFDPVKYYQEKASYESLSQKSDDDLISEMLYKKYGKYSEENTDGLTEEDVKEHIQGMNKIQKKEQANSYRDILNQEKERTKQDYIEKQTKEKQEKFKEYREKSNSDIIKKLDTDFENIKKINNIAGLEFGETEHLDTFQKFKDDLTINEDGKTGFVEKLYNMTNEDLYKLYVFMSVGDEGFKENFSNLKNKTKEQILNSMDINPDTGGGSSSQESGDVDVHELSKPD